MFHSRLWKRRLQASLCVILTMASLLLLIRSRSSPAPGTCLDRGERSLACSKNVVAWLRGARQHTGYLQHVREVLELLGYTVANYSDEEAATKPWHLLWSHTYPFKALRSVLIHLKPHQMVNHFPGTGFISNKVTLAESELSCVPRAFRLPSEKLALLQYAQLNPSMMFVLKSNNHRGIQVKPLSELDLNTDGSFVQEFVHNPLLVDGRKFDIGVYVVLTSVQPLRVYVYNGDTLFRFCGERYHPFDSSVQDKYVVGDSYTPIWKMPSLVPFYSLQGYSMKDSFNAWLKSEGRDSSVIWEGIDSCISEVFYKKENIIMQAVSNYKSRHNFFEMMRFDFIVDDKLRVYLMEANMSPNLSSAHFRQNKLFYRQIVKSILSVSTLSVAEQIALLSVSDGSKDYSLNKAEVQQTTVSLKDISVFPEHCVTNCISDNAQGDNIPACDDVSCQLCPICMSEALKEELNRAYLEHLRRSNMRRLIPPPLFTRDAAHSPANVSGMNPDNTLLTEWFRGKCLLDHLFCS